MAKSYCTVKFYSNFPINEYSNQFYISNQSNRDSMFDSFCKNRNGIDVFNNIATVDKSKMTFRLETDYESAMHFNYGVVIEKNKRYYFFVNNVEWSSNLITATFHCEVDYWQTYCYNITFKRSYIEREHVYDDTFGLHIIDENLPITDYKVMNDGSQGDDKSIIVSNFYLAISLSDSTLIAPRQDGVPPDFDNPLPCLFKSSTREITPITLVVKDWYDDEQLDYAQWIINALVAQNKENSINGMYLIPSNVENRLGKCWLNVNGTIDIDGTALDYIPTYYIKQNTQLIPMVDYAEISRPDRIDNYIPHNNKCFCYPYNFVNITNNNGNNIKAKFEFSNDKDEIHASVLMPLEQDGSMSCFLTGYDGVTKNLDYSLSSTVYPQVPYITNTYSAYMSANQNSIATQYNNIDRLTEFGMDNAMVQGITGIVSGGLGGGGHLSNMESTGSSGSMGAVALGTSVNMINAATNSVLNMYGTALNGDVKKTQIDASLKDIKSRGNVAHGSFNPSCMLLANQYGFKFQLMNVTRECIIMIDNYFDMFGYKVNRIGTPQFDSRPSWNYVKTSGVNIIGNVPQIALNVIKDMFNGGTTIWHNLNTMYDYAQNNKRS